MKKVFKISFLIAAFAFITSIVFAQQPDSTTVSGISGALSSLSKIPSLAKIFGTLWILSEIIGAIPEQYVKANGVINMVWRWAKFFLSLFPKKVSPKSSILLVLLCAAAMCNGQSIFKPYPKPGRQLQTRSFAQIADSVTTTFNGNTYTAFRLTGPTVMYALSSGDISSSTLGTFVGIDYEHGTFDPLADKYYTDWAIGLQGGEGGQLAPSSLSAVTMLAFTLSTQKIGKTELPFKITAAVIYNFTTGKPMAGFGPGTSLNN